MLLGALAGWALGLEPVASTHLDMPAQFLGCVGIGERTGVDDRDLDYPEPAQSPSGRPPAAGEAVF